MDLTFLWFGVASAAVTSFSFAASPRGWKGPCSLMAVVLFIQWGVSNWLQAGLGEPLAYLGYPPLDALGMTALVYLAQRELRLGLRYPPVWMMALAATYMIQLACHVVYLAQPAQSMEATYAYLLALNILFAMQIVLVAIPGAANVARNLGSRFGRFLHGLGRRRVPGAAQTGRAPRP